MTDKFDSLTDEDVRQIGLLIEILDKSSFDYLRVDVGNLKVIVGKGALPPEVSGGASAAVPTPVTAVEQAPASAKPSEAKVHGDDVVEVIAPMIGRFYAQPEPGAAPFVALGAQVTPGTTVGLLEVMKVYTSVSAGFDGVICEICVQDGAYVEFGAVLFRIKKTSSAPTSKRSRAPAKA